MAVLNRTSIALVASLLIALAPRGAGANPSLVRDLTLHGGEVPQRLVGYGLVVGLEGTGDRSFGGISSRNATVRSVVNLLRRFDVEVPGEYMRLRNVAAVLVTAEVSPYLRAGGRFEVQVSALGDAISLDGGVLWITPLVTDPQSPAVATAQGPLLMGSRPAGRAPFLRQANSVRIPEGGILEVDPPPIADAGARLVLRSPNWVTAKAIADAINAARGEGTAVVEDPGSIQLTLPEGETTEGLVAIDMLPVTLSPAARVVIHEMDGTIVIGGDVRVGAAVIHHNGITLEIGGESSAGANDPIGLLRMEPETLVQDVAAGLHAAGARPAEIAAIFEALRDAGAITAEVVVR
jgi:flagellar P-ring protein precursor FlgI